MRNDIVVGLMVRREKKRAIVLKKYSRHNNLGIKLISFVPKDIDWKNKSVRALYLDKGLVMEQSLPLPQMVFNRCYVNPRKTIRRIEGILGKNKIINYINRLNKLHIYNILEKTELKEYLPYTCLYDEKKLQEVFQSNKLIFLKPCVGNQGRGVYRIELCNKELRISENSLPPKHIWRLDDEQLPWKVEELLKGKQYILQCGIPFAQLDERYFDLRALVQKNVNGNWEITNIISRSAFKGYYNTSLIENVQRAEVVLNSLFPSDKSDKILQSLRKISIDAAVELEKELGLMAELCVDFAIDDNGVLRIIEVNGKPNKQIYKDIMEIHEQSIIYQRPLEYALFLLQ